MSREILPLILKKIVEIDGAVKVRTLKKTLKAWGFQGEEEEAIREVLNGKYVMVTISGAKGEEEIIVPKEKSETLHLLSTIKGRGEKMEMVDIILRSTPYLMPYGFPEDYLKEKLKEVIPSLPIFRINNLYFTLEVRSGNLYVEYLFREHAGIKDVVKTYAFLGVLARKLGYRYIFGDATPERVKSYEKISAEPTLLWKLPVFLSPVRYMPGDARTRIKAPVGSIRLDIFRAFYVINLEDVDVRSLTREELEEYGEWIVNFVKEAGAVVFFGNALTIIELGKWLRYAGIPVAEDGVREHYSLTFLVKKAWEIPIIKRFASREDILNEAKIVIGGKEYEFGSPETAL